MPATVNQRSILGAFSFFFFLSSFPSLSMAALSSDQVDSLLGNLLRGDYSVSYEAEEVTIRFSHGEPRISRYKVGKLKPHKMRREKYALDGSVEEIMVHDDELQIVSYPQKNIVVREPRSKNRPGSGDTERLIRLVRKNYDVDLAGNAVIASRAAIIVSIKPKERESRPSFKVWVDHETSMPLKTETYTADGSLTFLSTLSNISVNPSFPQDYFVIMVPSGTTAYEQPQRETKSSEEEDNLEKLSYHKLSGGYELKERLLDEKGNLQLIYHDGLNMVSFFSEDWTADMADALGKMNESPGGVVERIKRKGFEGYYCNRGGENILNFISDKHRYVIVGEVSKEGLIDMAIEFKKRKLGK